MPYPLLADYSDKSKISNGIPMPIAKLKQLGCVGVIRYVTGRANLREDYHKDLFPRERDALLEAGLSINLVYQLNQDGKNVTPSVGAEVAKKAERHAAELGAPPWLPIFYSIDYEATLAQVANYFDGINSVAKREVGIYSGRLIEAVIQSGAAKWGWQTLGWSRFNNIENGNEIKIGDRRGDNDPRIMPHADLFQYYIINGPGGYDLNELRNSDLPRWVKKATPPPVPETWWVDPAKVTTTLLGRDLTGKAKEGRALGPGSKVVGFPKNHPVTGRAVIVTADGISYAKDFLTATDPNVVIPPPVRPFPLVPVYTVKERIAFRNRRTCVCVATSLPWVEYRMLEAGVIQNNIDIAQMGYNRGGVAASAGTHDAGGNTDVGQYSEAALTIWREMGWTQQHRTPAQGFANHAHGWPKGCTHLSDGGKYQVSEWEAGRNGLRGRGAITGPAPKGRLTPTWVEALAAYKRKVGFTAPMADADEFEIEIYHDLPMPSGFDDGSNTPHS